jgi:hypothetical protein
MTHSVVVDLLGGRRAELGEVVARRLGHCAGLAGFQLPADAQAEHIYLHGEAAPR